MGMNIQIPTDQVTIWNRAYHLQLQSNIEQYFTLQQIESWDILTVNGDGDPLTATLRVNAMNHNVVFTWNSDGTMATYSINHLGSGDNTMTVTFSYDSYGNAEFTVSVI